MASLPNIHPGDVLRDEFLVPLGISQNALARVTGVPPRRINEIVLGKRGITADTAVRLAAALGTTERFWLSLQADYELEEARRLLGDFPERIKRLVPTGCSVTNVESVTLARANLSELADQAKAGAEKIITKNGESYVALIDADRLDYYHRLERERIHLLVLDDAKRGLADIAAGRTVDADAAIDQLQQRRAAIKTPDGVSPGKRAAKKRG